jgi:DNA-nicking Smr family endonuclease
MLGENISTIPMHRTPPPPQSVPAIRSNSMAEPVLGPYENLRHDALRHAQKRKEFYTKAHQANCHGMSGVASFYIQQAIEETRLMKDANRVVCERLSRWKLKQYHQTQQLDLHGLHSNEALSLFKQIEQEFNDGNGRTTTKSIEIITGYGKIRSIILGYLHQRNYK